MKARVERMVVSCGHSVCIKVLKCQADTSEVVKVLIDVAIWYELESGINDSLFKEWMRRQ